MPKGLIDEMSGRESAGTRTAVDAQESAARARNIIMEVERNLGFDPTDREFKKLGYDIESRVPDTGKLRFIEVKGRASGASTITVTRNEILYSLNKPEDYILGIVEFQDRDGYRVHYVREPFQREPDFGVTSVNYDFAELLARAEEPHEGVSSRQDGMKTKKKLIEVALSLDAINKASAREKSIRHGHPSTLHLW